MCSPTPILSAAIERLARGENECSTCLIGIAHRNTECGCEEERTSQRQMTFEALVNTHMSYRHDRPKALKAIKEERSSAKQEMKAVSNVASYAGLDLSRIFPSSPLLPLNPERERRLTTVIDNCAHAYVTDKSTGASRWDCPMPQAGSESHVRLVLCPDEGGPLWSAYQYMAHNHAAVGFRRDELLLDCPE